MIWTVSAIAIILISWALLAILLTGVGLGVMRIFGSTRIEPRELWLSFWAGFAAIIAWLQLWHLFLPVDGLTVLSVLPLSVPGLILGSRKVVALLRQSIRLEPAFFGVVVLLVCYLAHRASGPPTGDARAYLHNIAWNHAYPIVVGSGGSSSPTISFNSTSYLWDALLEFGFGHTRSYHVCNSLFICAVAIRSLRGIWRLWHQKAEACAVDYYFALLSLPVCAQVITLLELRISSTDSDLAVALTFFVLIGEWIRQFDRLRFKPILASDMLWLTLMASLLGTLKLSTLPLAGCCVIWPWIWWFGNDSVPKANRMRTLAGGVGVAVLLGVPWIFRSIIMTGYPFYPVRVFAVKTAWTASSTDSHVTEILNGILVDKPLFHALMPGYTHWIYPYLYWQATRSPELILLPAAIVMTGVILICGFGLSLSKEPRGVVARFGYLLMLPPLLIGIVAWWFALPEPRYVFHAFWAAAGIVLAEWFSRPVDSDVNQKPSDPLKGGRRFAWIVMVGVLLIPLHRIAAWTAAGKPENAMATLVLPPGPDYGLHVAPDGWYPKLPPPEQILTWIDYVRGNPNHLNFVVKARLDPVPPDPGLINTSTQPSTKE